MSATDYSAHKRVVIVEHGRVSGQVVVLMASPRAYVTPLDVTLWDEGRVSGRIIYSDAFTAKVEDGVCSLPEHMIRADRRNDVLEVLDEVKATCVAAVEVLHRGEPVENTEEKR